MDEHGSNLSTLSQADMIAAIEHKLAQVEEKLRHLEELRDYLKAKLEQLRSA